MYTGSQNPIDLPVLDFFKEVEVIVVIGTSVVVGVEHWHEQLRPWQTQASQHWTSNILSVGGKVAKLYCKYAIISKGIHL